MAGVRAGDAEVADEGSGLRYELFKGSKKDNTDVIAFDYQPIWTIFPLEVAVDMEEIILDYYKDKKLGINLSQFATE